MAIKTARCNEPGRPQVDRDRCTVCGLCAEACPTYTLRLQGGRLEIELDTEFGCIGCGQCLAICPKAAVTVSGRDISPQDAIELPPPAARAQAEQLESLMLARRSVRNYADREVEPQKIEQIIEMASSAPMGIPPTDVEILAFAGRRNVQAFALDICDLMRGTLAFFTPAKLVLMRPMLGKANVEILKGFVLPLCREIVGQRERGRDALLYNAPVAMLFHGSAFSDPLDAGIAATYAMLAAESLELGTCMIGSVCPFLARNRKTMEKYGIKRDNKLSIVLVMGYPQHKFSRAIRRSFAAVRFFGQ
jgi:ferredoxin